MTHKVEAKVAQTGCTPSVPPPTTDEQPCTGTMQGTITMECCCPRLYTRTQVLAIGPQTETSLRTFLQNTVNAYEASGYLILAHSLIDTGAGWQLGLTVGWYA